MINTLVFKGVKTAKIFSAEFKFYYSNKYYEQTHHIRSEIFSTINMCVFFFFVFVIHALDSYFDYSLGDYFLIVWRKLLEPNNTKLDSNKLTNQMQKSLQFIT